MNMSWQLYYQVGIVELRKVKGDLLSAGVTLWDRITTPPLLLQ